MTEYVMEERLPSTEERLPILQERCDRLTRYLSGVLTAAHEYDMFDMVVSTATQAEDLEPGELEEWWHGHGPLDIVLGEVVDLTEIDDQCPQRPSPLLTEAAS